MVRRRKDGKSPWSPKEAARSARDGVEVEFIFSDEDLERFFRHFQRKWKRLGPEFIEFWNGISRKTRRSLFTAIFPHCAISLANPYNVLGKSAVGNAQMFPDLLVSSVSNYPLHLPNMYTAIAAHESYRHFLKKCILFCRARGVCGNDGDELNVVEMENFTIVARYDLSKPGATREKGRVEMFQMLRNTRTLVPEHLYRGGVLRCETLLQVLSAIFDEWEDEVRKTPRNESLMSVFFGCSREGCTNRSMEDGRPLQSCSRCRISAYCSKNCQRLDWTARHKAICGDPKAASRSKVKQLSEKNRVKGRKLELMEKEGRGGEVCSKAMAANPAYHPLLDDDASSESQTDLVSVPEREEVRDSQSLLEAVE